MKTRIHPPTPTALDAKTRPDAVLEYWQQRPWQEQLANAVSCADELFDLLGLPKNAHPALRRFGLKAPHAFVAKMRRFDARDPLLLQTLPSAEEFAKTPGFGLDPLGESAHNPIKGLLHKYRSRVLITLTGACAVHCRYCFRRHFDYQSNAPKSDAQDAILRYIRQNPDVNEAILSGGDPLSVSNRRLFDWIDKLGQTPIKTIRLHTRLPVALPARVDDELVDFFARFGKKLVIVVHTNHPNEIDAATARAFLRLKASGATLLNQSVLLRGVNDDVDTLVRLSYALFDADVLPYYLHALDKVAGSAHFYVPPSEAARLYWALLERLPGYLAPKFVQEEPDKPHKTPVDIYKRR